MIKLTEKNYYDKGTKALTCSKMKDYSLCPNYFYRKHIIGELVEDPSDSFIIGSMVDEILTSKSRTIGNRFEIVSVRSKGAKEVAAEMGKTLVLNSQFEEACSMADAALETEAWQYIKSKGKFQAILQVEMFLGKHFESLAGKPDVWWKENNGKTGIIVDLKTAVSADHRSFYYRAMDYHYHWQQANYRHLLSILNPMVREWKCYNFVIGKDKLHTCNLFQYTEDQLALAENQLMSVMNKIKFDTEFKKADVTFNNPIRFGDFEQSRIIEMMDAFNEEDN